MADSLETISDTQTDHALELATLAQIAFFVCNQSSVVVFQAGLQSNLETFQELIAQRAVPVHIEMTEITVIVRIIKVISVLVACLP